MDEINDFIHIHENALEPEVCDFLVNLFEENTDKHEVLQNDGRPNFTQFNLTENKKISEEVNGIHNQIIRNVLYHKSQYYEFVNKNVFPDENAFEQFRIKRYVPGGEERFDTHVDVSDYSSARRFLSFFWYLNDVGGGGETIFKDLEIKPEKGKLVIFPPLWLFPHRGMPPISGPKYLLSTYLHYK